MTAASNSGKVGERTPFPKLVMGHILQFSLADGAGGVPSDEAIIHFEGDEDSEINIRCPGALRLAPLIVTACNNFEPVSRQLKNSADALDYCLSVLPKDELLRIKIEATVAAARTALAALALTTPRSATEGK